MAGKKTRNAEGGKGVGGKELAGKKERERSLLEKSSGTAVCGKERAE
jgi:hypothetical protein